MRLIDADALTEDFKGRIEPCDKWIKEANEETKPRAKAIRAFINEVILTIQYAPTIEPDRPHGEWKYAIVDCYKSGYICPHCNGFAVIDGKSDGYSVTFCPNCGRNNRPKEGDMDG